MSAKSKPEAEVEVEPEPTEPSEMSLPDRLEYLAGNLTNGDKAAAAAMREAAEALR